MPRHRLQSHEGLRAGAQLPDYATVSALIERQDVVGGHWHWLGDFTRHRVALLPVVQPDGVTAKLMVPRLLLQIFGGFERGFGVLNQCGLVSCVNPSHWCVETPQQRGQSQRPMVLTDFHGKGWTMATRTDRCPICRRPPEKPCDPVYHDAEFRRRTAAEATSCPVCNAMPHQDCNTDVHRLVFQHEMAMQKKRAIDDGG